MIDMARQDKGLRLSLLNISVRRMKKKTFSITSTS
jgi:hypothetical protein